MECWFGEFNRNWFWSNILKFNKYVLRSQIYRAFGFIKPWTAVRDGETFSQQFLTPSIIEGIEKGISRIVRHKLSYSAINSQQEQTQTRGWEFKRTEKRMIRPLSILNRGIMINPVLHLAFKK